MWHSSAASCKLTVPDSHFVSSYLSQVTLIPTHDTEVTREWYQQTHERQQDLNIMVLASSSTVVMQDESFPACKIEFWASRATLCSSPPLPFPIPSSPSLSALTGARANFIEVSHGTRLNASTAASDTLDSLCLNQNGSSAFLLCVMVNNKQ